MFFFISCSDGPMYLFIFFFFFWLLHVSGDCMYDPLFWRGSVTAAQCITAEGLWGAETGRWPPNHNEMDMSCRRW